jgi:hypothetical protein
MNLPKLFQRGCTLRVLALGVALSGGFCHPSAQAESANGAWPRAYSVDDDDIVIYQPKVEKWDQKLLVARFAVGVKGKNDAKPIYGSFVAQAETEANMENRTVSVFNVTAVEFKFPDAGNRIDHIKRDIAAVSPQQPLSLPLDDLTASAASGDSVAEEGAPEEESPADDTETPAKAEQPERVAGKKGVDEPPAVIAMEKGEFPQPSVTKDNGSDESDASPSKAERISKSKPSVAQDRVSQKKVFVKKVSQEEATSSAEVLKEDPSEESVRVVRGRKPAPSSHVRVVHKTETKPHVVRYVRGKDSRFACFDRKVYCGAHGEVVRHSEKHRVLKLRHSSQDNRS